MKQAKRIRYVYGVRIFVLALLVIWVSSQGNVPVFAEGTESIEGLFEALQVIALDEPLKAPDFSLTSVNGETKSLSDYQGQLVFLNFWTTW